MALEGVDTEEWAEVVLKEVDNRSTPSCQGTKECTDGPLCVCPRRSGPKWYSREWSIGPLLRTKARRSGPKDHCLYVHGGVDRSGTQRSGPSVHYFVPLPSTPPCQISPHRSNDKSVGPPKLKILLKFYQISEYKRYTGAYPLRDFHENCRISGATAVKIWMDLLDGYGVMGVLS